LEDKAEQDYGLAMVALDIERKELARLEDERSQQLMHFRNSIRDAVNPAELRTLNNYIELLKKRIAAQENRVKTAQDASEVRRAELTEAMKQRKMLETLHDNAKNSFMKETIKAEQRDVEELVSYKFVTR
jgi:flagellar FliJ protein